MQPRIVLSQKSYVSDVANRDISRQCTPRGGLAGGSRLPMSNPPRNKNNRLGHHRGKTQGKLYGHLNCTNVEQVGMASNVIMGMLNILPLHGKVLFDSEATTSFISSDFMEKLGSRCCVLPNPISIISTRGSVTVTRIR